ncbi:MAG: hypothetical protein A2Y94_13830 [Caldithrix sp. RBG_13_44_9]|nr:MAG: hypothetical protein A2Y94_13830 [Caldithrix sp. RBG_13_44_9]
MSERSYSQKCEKCGEFFVTRVIDPKTICEKCFLMQRVKEKIYDLIQRHPYMAYGREMLVLLDEIETKLLKYINLTYPDNSNCPFLDYFKHELRHIQNIKEKCHYRP